jgi:hypothetical protein
MRRNIFMRSITLVVATFLRVSLSTTIAIAGSSSASQADSMERTTLSKEAPDQIVSGQEVMPLDAFGYLGGLFEARFYEPHSTTGNPRDEIRQAASLYGLDLAMMMSIAKVESNFNPRTRTGSYKGLFQLSDYEFKKYGDGSIWDARDNARAAAHMFLVQAEKFKSALGHYPDYAERYMVHQQGIEGAIEHYTHPERVAWQSMCATDEGVLKGEEWCRKCIWRNLLPKWKHIFGSVDKISSGDFVSLWTGRIDHLANRFLDFAIAQQPPAANAQPPQAAFVNDALAVPEAPANTDTIPARFSEKNAADDKLITLAYTFKTLSNEERRAIYEALRDKPTGAAFNEDIGVKLPVDVALQPVPPDLANNVPQTKGYYYAVTHDRVLLVSPVNRTVVGVFAEDKAR